MIKNNLSIIVGLKIADADLSACDAGILFENGVVLSIYNQFYLKENKDIIGKKVISTDGKNDLINIYLNDGNVISVDMNENAYSSPEAMRLELANGNIIIWQ